MLPTKPYILPKQTTGCRPSHRPLQSCRPENPFNHADFTAQQLGVYSQHDWTKSINKRKFNQLVDDAAANTEVAQAVNFADLAKQAQLHAQFSQLRSEDNNYFNILTNSLLSEKHLQLVISIGVI